MKINLTVNIKEVLIGYQFDSSMVVTIGREMGNSIAPLAEGLSRHHAKIYFKDGDWYAEDLGSTNGSYRRGEKIEGSIKLVDGDRLRFGLVDVSIELLKGEAEAPKAEAPAEAVPDMPAVPDMSSVPDLPPVSDAAPAAAAPAAAKPSPLSPLAVKKPTLPGVRKPVLPALKSGIKLPPKPGAALRPGIKLPPKPGASV